jgi:hypothetical protein
VTSGDLGTIGNAEVWALVEAPLCVHGQLLLCHGYFGHQLYGVFPFSK